MAKAAFAAWGKRIAPVFDVVREIRLVEAEAGKALRETKEPVSDDLPVQKALRLAELGVGTLVCGAISRTLLEMIAANGIQVIAFVAGDLHEVIQAWLEGDLDQDTFAMPGCCRRGRGRLRKEQGGYDEKQLMRGGNEMMWQGGGRGQGGGGRRRGQGGRGQGRMGGPTASGPGGNCVCRQCGRKEPHERGVPCVERRCPNCGAAMTRE